MWRWGANLTWQRLAQASGECRSLWAPLGGQECERFAKNMLMLFDNADIVFHFKRQAPRAHVSKHLKAIATAFFFGWKGAVFDQHGFDLVALLASIGIYSSLCITWIILNPCGSASGYISCCVSSGASRAIQDVGIAWVHTGARSILRPENFWVCQGSFCCSWWKTTSFDHTCFQHFLPALNLKVTRLEVVFGKCNSDSLY